MSENVTLKAQLIAATSFFPPEDIDFDTDADGGEALIEFSGRACYETWDKPNPRTATNRGYLRHVLEVGHTSLFEHASASIYVCGLSRSCAHELTRHRHFSFSQLSQRFVPASSNNVVVPPAIAEDPDLLRVFESAVDQSRFAYGELLDALEEKWADEPNAILRRKQARQAARAVLPMPPKLESWLLVISGLGATSFRCVRPSMPMLKFGSWQWLVCGSCSAALLLLLGILRSTL